MFAGEGSNGFTIEYHYGGKVKYGAFISYKEGSLKYRDWCNMDFICLLDIVEDVRVRTYRMYKTYGLLLGDRCQ